MRKFIRKILMIPEIGTVVEVKHDEDMFGNHAGTKKVVTGYCKYYYRLGYRLDGDERAIYLREDFRLV
jgi:hypothetical protein